MVLKRKVAAIVLMFSMLPIFSVYANGASGESDDRAGQLLYALGIIERDENGEVTTEQRVTRAELCVMAVRMLGLEEVVSGTNTDKQLFFDVPLDYPSGGYIHTAYQLGLINGNGDGHFKPEDAVTYEESLKVIICALKYDYIAEISGGYPTGYIATAKKLQLDSGVINAQSFYITRKDLLQVIYNALMTNPVNITGFGALPQYEVRKDITLLNEVFNVYEQSGIITANDKTRIPAGTPSARGTVVIDNEVYNIGATNADSLAGGLVTVFYKSERGKDRTILAVFEESRNNINIINAEDVVSFDGTQLTFWTDKSKGTALQKAKLSPNVDIALNGEFLNHISIVPPVPDCGEFMLLDNNGDGVYDIVDITSYSTVAVHHADAQGLTIYGKYGLNSKIELEYENYEIRDVLGEQVRIEDIKEWDILAVKYLEANNFYYITLVNQSAELTVTEIIKNSESGFSNDSVIISDGVEYDVAKSYYAVLSEPDIAVGEMYEAYLDIYGKIAALNKIASSSLDWSYVYLIACAEQDGLDKNIRIKTYTPDETFEIYTIEKKTIYNGESMSDVNVMKAFTSLEGNTVTQLIRIKFNKEGRINAIETAKPDLDAYGQRSSGLRKIADSDNTTLKYKASSRTVGGLALITAQTKVMVIPGADQLNNESLYAVSTSRYFAADGMYAVEAYTSRQNSYAAEIMIVRDTQGQVANDSSILLVEKIVDAATEDGIAVKKVYGIRDGQKISLLVQEGISLPNIQGGDCIQYSTNSKNQINAARIAFKELTRTVYSTTGEASNPSITDFVNVFRLEYASAFSKVENVLKIAKPDTLEVTKELYVLDRAKVYIYDKSSDRNEKGHVASVNDIVTYEMSKTGFSQVLIYTRGSDPRTIIIYK